jgi:hypothetical protein
MVNAPVPATPPAPSPPPKSFFDRWIGVITSVLAVVSTILAIWNVWLTGTVNQLNQKLSVTTAERDWSGKIFDKYSSAVTARDLSPDQRVAALAPLANLVVLINNQDVRDGLGKSITDQVNVYRGQLEIKSGEQDQAAQAQTDVVIRQAAAVAEQAEKATTQGAAATKAAPAAAAGRAYNFDIFWCQTWPGAEGLAGRIAALKGRMKGNMGNWRVRMLAETINKRPGYGKRGLVINYGNSEELAQAQTLKAEIEADSALAVLLPPVRVLPVPTETPGYLSAFICPL